MHVCADISTMGPSCCSPLLPPPVPPGNSQGESSLGTGAPPRDTGPCCSPRPSTAARRSPGDVPRPPSMKARRAWCRPVPPLGPELWVTKDHTAASTMFKDFGRIRQDLGNFPLKSRGTINSNRGSKRKWLTLLANILSGFTRQSSHRECSPTLGRRAGCSGQEMENPAAAACPPRGPGPDLLTSSDGELITTLQVARPRFQSPRCQNAFHGELKSAFRSPQSEPTRQ
ncbi:hypothetical protein H1C71_012301, partial [Ictidomys tridecemlineatus]